METLSRPKDDARRLLSPKEYKSTLEDLAKANRVEEPVLIVTARDRRTEVGPYIDVNSRMPNLGARIIASELGEAGFPVRIVFGAWNPNFSPAQAMIDWKRPTSLMISSMLIHYNDVERLLDDAYKLENERPWIGVGGPLAMYEPWAVLERENGKNADLVFTGGGFALHQVNQRLDQYMRSGMTRRQVLEELKRERLLDDIPGLMYSWQDRSEEFLVATGPQRMLTNFDVLPSGIDAFELAERPHDKPYLMEKPLTFDEIRAANTRGFGPFRAWLKMINVLSLLTTHGCPENCNYCPIPEQAQGTFSSRSVDNVINDILKAYEVLGVTDFFGTDDNIYMSQPWVRDFVEKTASVMIKGKHLGELVSFGTEGTVKGAFAAVNRDPDFFKKVVQGGWKSTWYGIEDMNAMLVDKGQDPEVQFWVFYKGREAGHRLRAMLIHHEGQPYTSRSKRQMLRVNGRKPEPETGTEVPLKVTFDRITLDANGGERHYDLPRKETPEEIARSGQYTVRLAAAERYEQKKQAEEAMIVGGLIGQDPKAQKLYENMVRLAGPNNYLGLVEQVKALLSEPFRAFSLQVNPLSPSPGTELWEAPFIDGKVLSRIGDIRLSYANGTGLYLVDGNHAIMVGKEADPWQIQSEQLKAYAHFYNPWEFAKGTVRAAEAKAQELTQQVLSLLNLAEASAINKKEKARDELGFVTNQALGMLGFAVSTWRSRDYLYQLWRASRKGLIERTNEVPVPQHRIIQTGIRTLYAYHENPALIALNGKVQPVYDMKANPPLLAPVR